ncbi:hypothetical protein EJB05_06131 [Eragrostis curvula]|uniref:Co-chaperone protein p23 n=1 Tax=Eragrostis curvula TaxID=38414 RepID=A0A5J9WEF6_9POAL|nr:hypothetical protein EJB05_06131 [Eragrostis curvula]
MLSHSSTVGPPEVKWAEAMDEIYITVQLPDAKDTIVKWAQAIDKVYITIQLPDAIDTTVNLEPEGTFTIRGNVGADGHLYLNLDLNGKVNVEGSETSVGPRSIVCIAEKAEAKWWKLVRDDQKVPRPMNDDGDKWVNEDVHVWQTTSKNREENCMF